MAIGGNLDDTKTVTRLSAIGSRRSAGRRMPTANCRCTVFEFGVYVDSRQDRFYNPSVL